MAMAVAAGPHPLLLVLLGVLLLGLVAVVLPYRREPRRKRFAGVVVMAVAFSTVGGLCVATAYNAYELNATYRFTFLVSLQGNGTYPESVIVPVPQDESLLSGLARTSGTANWSLVDTPHGRGLFVRFEGTADLEAKAVRFPPPASPTAGEPTMPVSSNCTAAPSNCTGPPQFWMFYSGNAGVYGIVMVGYEYVRAYPSTGWAAYDVGWAIP